MANRVVCATLSIPIPPTRYSIDQLLESNDTEKRRRLASLLSLSAPPTRASLVKDLVCVYFITRLLDLNCNGQFPELMIHQVIF